MLLFLYNLFYFTYILVAYNTITNLDEEIDLEDVISCYLVAIWLTTEKLVKQPQKKMHYTLIVMTVII